MATLSKAAFLSKYNTLFADNVTRDILEATMREFTTDVKDSFLNLTDSPPMSFGGDWAFPGSAFPVATLAGTLYRATADHGVPGDPDYVTSGTRFVSLIAGADEFDEFTYF